MSEQLVDLVAKLAPLDREDPILGSFLIERAPVSANVVPQEISSLWPGMQVPVRYPDRLELQDIAVTPGDIVASLIAQGCQNGAAWFNEHMRRRGLRHDLPYWEFYVSEGELGLDAPIPTARYYSYLSGQAIVLPLNLETDNEPPF